MVNEELVSIVQEVYYQQKKTRAEVKKVLLDHGWKEEDIKEEEIDKAIIYIRNQALRKLPIISAIYKFFDQLENKYQHMSTRAIIIVLVVAVFWLFLVAFAVYLIYDPLTVTNKTFVAPSSVVLPAEGDEISFP